MTPRFGIDTSVLVRLLTGRPEDTYTACRNALQRLIEDRGARILVSNMVIGEAYIAVQHHYGVSKEDARDGLLKVLQSGMVSPLHGRSVLAAIADRSGAGLLDRLIADDFRRAQLVTLTLDRRMSALPATELLLPSPAPQARTARIRLLEGRGPEGYSQGCRTILAASPAASRPKASWMRLIGMTWLISLSISGDSAITRITPS